MTKLSRLRPQASRNRTSKGESEVYNLLRKILPTAVMWTEYPYYQFTNTINRKLKADVFIQSFSIAVEFQGELHYKAVDFGKDEKSAFEAKRAFEERQKLDEEKRRLTKESNIKLLEIDYKEWKNLKTESNKIKWLQDSIYQLV